MRKSRLLLVDDEAIILRTLFIELKERGYDVTIAQDGKAALQLFQQQPFDLLITDQMMSGLDGMELIRAVKKLSPTTVCLLLTGYQDWSQESLVRLSEVDDFLMKPCHPQEIYFRIQRALELHRLRERVKALDSASV